MTLKEQVMEKARIRNHGQIVTTDVYDIGKADENARLIPLIETLATEIERLRGALEMIEGYALEKLNYNQSVLRKHTLADNQRAMEKVGIKL